MPRSSVKADPAIYFDYAAATPMAAEVSEAIQPYFSERFFNPSAQYLAAKKVHSDLATARTAVAACLNARAGEIYFAAGGTEANNLAIRGVLEQYPDGNVIVSAIEHESILEPAKKFQYKIAPVTDKGVVDLQALEQLIDDKTVLVSVMYANNEVGSIQPITEITQIIREKRKTRFAKGRSIPLLFHTDACQAANYLQLSASGLGVDIMTLNGGKIYGPKQSGALFVKAGVVLSPQVLGGGQEYGLRSGTENVAGAIGFAEALKQAVSVREVETKRLQALQVYFFNELTRSLPKVVVNGPLKNRLPNNIHVTFPGYDNERLMMELDERGIQCATGSACSAAKGKPSHVLAAMGISDKDAQASLRFTMGRHTTKANIDALAKALKELVD